MTVYESNPLSFILHTRRDTKWTVESFTVACNYLYHLQDFGIAVLSTSEIAKVSIANNKFILILQNYAQSGNFITISIIRNIY